MATSTDKKVQQLFEVVQKKKEEIKKAEKPNWLTNCSFRLDENNTSSSFNIQTISDPNILVLAHARLTMLEEAALKSADELGIEKYQFSWLGFPASDWKSDFKTRIDKINIKKKKDELTLLESRLDKLISPELRAELEISLIEKELGI